MSDHFSLGLTLLARVTAVTDLCLSVLISEVWPSQSLTA